MPDNKVEWHSAWLGLGGNIGNPARFMALALAALDAREDCRLVAVSRLYKTPPWGKTDQAWFFNCCAEISTRLQPVALLDACLETERSLKRVRKERWGPRTIDIDILVMHDPAMEEVHLNDGRLSLPHPRMTERGFVLVPLNDIAPDLVVAEKPVRFWLNQADRTDIALAGDPDWWKIKEADGP